MGKLSGLLVLMVGVLVLAYAMPYRDNDPALRQTARGIDVAAPLTTASLPAAAPERSQPEALASGAQRARTFSPQNPLLGSAPGVETASSDVKVTASVAPTSDSAAVRRTLPQRPLDEDAKRELARDIQKELKRVGCYDGDVSGAWGGASKKAMTSFIERVNATLPVEEPDYILLTLLQGHSAKACSKDCPSGQSVGSDGRCIPNSILSVQAARKSNSQEAKARVPARPRDSQQVATVAPANSWSTRVVPSQPDAPQQRIEKGPIVAAAPAAPLPGRMTIGAARSEDLVEVKPSATTIDQSPVRGPRQPRDFGLAADAPDSATAAEDKSSAKKPVRAAAVSRAEDEAADEPRLAPRKQARQSEPEPEQQRAAAARRYDPRPPVVIYRPAQTRYAAPGPVYRAPPRPVYTATQTQRNWKHAIFNDITRMR